MVNLNDSGRDEYYLSMEHDIISDGYKTTVVVLGGLDSLLAVLVNTTVLVIILSESTLRRSVFLWNLSSLCVAGLLSGAFIIPLNTSRFHKERWIHGTTVCKILIVLDYVQLSLPAIILVFSNLNRMLKIQRESNPLAQMGCLKMGMLQFVFLLSPWVYVFCVCVPLLVAAEASKGVFESVFKDFCFYTPKSEYILPMLALMIVIPFILLLTSVVALGFYYHLKSSTWSRISSSGTGNIDTTDVVGSVKSTIGATIISSVVFLCCWTPDVVVIIKMFTCNSFSCFPTESTYLSTYTSSCAASFLSQIPWFFITDVRLRMHELGQLFLSKLTYTFDKMRRCCCSTPLSVSWSNDQSLLEGSDVI